MKKVAFYTLGCKVNQYETDTMSKNFSNAGYEIVDFSDIADVYVINTCTVTGHGDKKSRHIIYKAKRQNPDAKIVVTGCLAQIAKKEQKEVNGADLLVGTEERKNIVQIVEEYLQDTYIDKPLQDIQSVVDFWESGEVISKERTRAYIKIEDGCDRYCTYCIIPYARGRVRSRNIDNIISEVKKLADAGFIEIVLIGIHLTSYGKDLKNITLVDVIEEVAKVDGIKRIRLGSLEPGFINPESVERLKKIDKLCPHFHLSLQSGCDETLKRMNRRYTTEEIREKVNLLRENFNDVSITTDIIVGFPGETEEEFNATYNYLKEINLSKMHVFPYSRRKGTKADTMPNQVDDNIKNKRAEILIELSDKNEEEFKKRFIGKNMDVILEKREKNGRRIGYNRQYVEVASESGKAGECVIIKGTEESLGLL